MRLRNRVTELEAQVANLEALASANQQDHNRLGLEIGMARAKANTNEAMINELTDRLWPLFIAGKEKLAELVSRLHREDE